MSIPEVTGFVVVSFGQIDIATVSPSERGAMVNWLVSSARIPIYAWTTDDEIFKTWRGCKGRDNHLMPVRIAAATVVSSRDRV